MAIIRREAERGKVIGCPKCLYCFALAVEPSELSVFGHAGLVEQKPVDGYGKAGFPPTMITNLLRHHALLAEQTQRVYVERLGYQDAIMYEQE